MLSRTLRDARTASSSSGHTHTHTNENERDGTREEHQCRCQCTLSSHIVLTDALERNEAISIQRWVLCEASYVCVCACIHWRHTRIERATSCETTFWWSVCACVDGHEKEESMRRTCKRVCNAQKNKYESEKLLKHCRCRRDASDRRRRMRLFLLHLIHSQSEYLLCRWRRCIYHI